MVSRADPAVPAAGGLFREGEETTFPTQTEAVPVEAAPPAGLHDPDDPVEVRYGDALRAYP